MIVTRTLAGLVLLLACGYVVLACGYAVMAAVAIGWSIVAVFSSDDPERIWAVPIVLAGALAIAGVRHAAPALWRTARTGEERSSAHRRFWLAWLAVLPFSVLFYWVAFVQVAFTAMALPVVALLLLAERYIQSGHDHSGSRTC